MVGEFIENKPFSQFKFGWVVTVEIKIDEL